MLGRIEGLVGTLYQESVKEIFRPSLFKGIENALEWIPTLVKDIDGTIKKRIDDLSELDVEGIKKVKDLKLTPEDETMFIECAGGLNEESKRKVLEFIEKKS